MAGYEELGIEDRTTYEEDMASVYGWEVREQYEDDYYGVDDPSDEGDDEDMDGEPCDSMDGDFDSAMTSAGFGTDEDYGYYGGDEY